MLLARSVTAKIHGSGTMIFKWVSGLNYAERTLLKKGGFLFAKFKTDHYKQSGYKIISYKFGKYIHREPTLKQLRAILQYEKIQKEKK